MNKERQRLVQFHTFITRVCGRIQVQTFSRQLTIHGPELLEVYVLICAIL